MSFVSLIIESSMVNFKKVASSQRDSFHILLRFSPCFISLDIESKQLQIYCIFLNVWLPLSVNSIYQFSLLSFLYPCTLARELG